MRPEPAKKRSSGFRRSQSNAVDIGLRAIKVSAISDLVRVTAEETWHLGPLATTPGVVSVVATSTFSRSTPARKPRERTFPRGTPFGVLLLILRAILEHDLTVPIEHNPACT